MAVEVVPFIQANSYGAEIVRLAMQSLLPQGIGGLTGASGAVVNDNDYVVSAGSGLLLNIAAGQGWVPGSVGSQQGLYYAYNDALVSKAITPDPSNPLWALVTVSVNDQFYGAGNPPVANNTGDVLVTQGVPSSSPAVPATPANSLLLARVYVPAAAASASACTITDYRRHLGTTATCSATQTNTLSLNGLTPVLIPFNNVTWDQAAAFSGGVYTCPVGGRYEVATCAAFNMPSGDWVVTSIYQNGAVVRQSPQMLNASVAPPNQFGSPLTAILRCKAGDTLAVYAFGNAGNTSAISTTAAANFLDIHLLSR